LKKHGFYQNRNSTNSLCVNEVILIGSELVGKYAIDKVLKIAVKTYRDKRFEN
jgi:hypothetical protein